VGGGDPITTPGTVLIEQPFSRGEITMRRDCFFVGLFLTATIGSFSAAQEPASPPAIGTGVGVGFSGDSQEDDPFAFGDEEEPLLRPVRDTLRSKPLSTDYIEKILDERLKGPLKFDNQPLREVIDFIREDYKLPMMFDIISLEEVAISPDTEISIDLDQINLRSAINIITQQPGLEDTCFAVINEMPMITTEEHARDSMTVRVYPTEDFVYDNGRPRGGAVSWADYSPLIDLITSCISPETWEENGSGHGQIKKIKPGILIVTQEYRVHVEIEKLLTDLRRELKVMEKKLGSEVLKETGRFYDGRQQSRPHNPGGRARGGGRF
jgi:hypothetical protein